jgi:hypothetical protein
MDAQIKQFIEANAPHFEVAVEGKSIRCKLTNHEMPMRIDVLAKYIEGKKYKHMRDWYAQDFTKYEPYIVSHRTNPKLLYCNVTKMELNKIPEEIEVHVNGRRYKKLLEIFVARYNKYNKPLAEGEEQFIVESSEEEEDDQDQQSDEEMSDADGEFEEEDSEFEVVPTTDNFEAMGPTKKAEDDDFDFSVVTNGNGDAMEEDDEEQGPAAKKQKLNQQSSKATSNGSSNNNGRKRKKPKQN